MKKNALSWIIGLMGVALLGVISLQAYWINQAIQLNSEHFDKNVFDAANAVVTRLEQEEVYEHASPYFPPDFGRATDVERQQILDVTQRVQSSIEHLLIQDTLEKSSVFGEAEEVFEEHGEDCTCLACQNSRINVSMENFYRQFTHAFAQSYVCHKPIEQRVEVAHFEEILTEELVNRGIDITYAFGIYSNEADEFVIKEIHLKKESKSQAKVLKASFSDLAHSNYKVGLFPNDVIQLPGYLILQFPGKKGYVWRSVLPTLLAAILFSGIILFCFAYTINIIFEQKKLSEIKNDFINNMTHEFKTPIATISLAADSINSPKIVDNPDKVKRFAGIIKAENKRMNSHVEKVLQMALLDKKEVQLVTRPLNIHELIEKSVESVSLQVERKDGVIIKDLRAENPIIEADETHFSSVIYNLLDNANKYTPEKPQITIRTRNVTGGVEITVEDNGLGMSKEQRKKIFDKFYRVSTGNRHDIKGFGLGLSYVKAIITEHRGDISVKSDLGKGSTFTLFFRHKVK